MPVPCFGLYLGSPACIRPQGRKTDAVELLRRRIEEVTVGRFIGLDAERVTFGDLTSLIVEDYEVNFVVAPT